MDRKAYPSDVSDDEWAFIAPYLTLMTEDSPQRVYPLREVFDFLASPIHLRYIARIGDPWRILPGSFNLLSSTTRLVVDIRNTL